MKDTKMKEKVIDGKSNFRVAFEFSFSFSFLNYSYFFILNVTSMLSLSVKA